VALSLIGAAVPSVAASSAATCQGLPVTIGGTPGNDRIIGTAARDVIDGGDGDDVIEGGDGGDVICGGPGDDRIHGNAGRDRLAGGSGDDTLAGGPGADSLFGGGGADTLGGATGGDQLGGGRGADTIRGGEGKDSLIGGAGRDECDGGPGIDRARRCETPLHTEAGDRPPLVAHPGRRFVALTFDDGPDPTWTPQLLDVLAEYHLHATFFVIGSAAARYPGIIRRMIREGHSVQNHTHSHAWLTRYSSAAAAEQIARGRRDIAAAGGVAPRCLRPPFGAISARIRAVAADEHQEVVMWDVDPQDWRYPSSGYLAAHVLRYTSGGDIVLLHDGAGPAATRSLPAIIDGLRDRGLEFTSICG